MRDFYYRTSCVESDGESITAMVDTAREITLATMRRHCADLAQWADGMGYCRGGLTLAKDWAVAYYKSTYKGQPCYFLTHSMIEYVWISEVQHHVTKAA